MRTRVTALIVAVLIVAVGASPGHARTFGQMIDDATTVASVKGKLAADRLSNLWEIDVKASEGVVTLSGKVDTAEHRDRIAQIAGWASGVKSVVNNIQVTGAEATSAKAPTADSGRPTTSGTTNGATTIDVTGSVATKDPATGTLTLADGAFGGDDDLAVGHAAGPVARCSGVDPRWRAGRARGRRLTAGRLAAGCLAAG
jgi:hypothetical protein